MPVSGLFVGQGEGAIEGFALEVYLEAMGGCSDYFVCSVVGEFYCCGVLVYGALVGEEFGVVVVDLCGGGGFGGDVAGG